jgi:excinuclease ABC subunit C
VVFGDGTDADVVAFAQDELEAAAQVFHVRGGRVRGQRGWVIDKVEEVSTGDLVEQFLGQIYGAGDDFELGAGAPDGIAPGGAGAGADSPIPREILVPELPEDADALTDWLQSRRGGRVDVRVPRRGDKRALMETVARNAAQALTQHKLKRASDLTARSLALSDLQDALELPDAPLRIECFDVSHVQGTNVVASMVVFEDGLARKSEYRRFAIRGTGGAGGPDGPGSADGSGVGSAEQVRLPVDADGELIAGGDVDWIHEAVRRRFARYLDEQVSSGPVETVGDESDDPALAGRSAEDPALTGKPGKFAYPPNLVVVDGGAPQVAAAQAALDELGIDDISIVGLAKRLEEVWLPAEPDPVILPRTSEALYLLQRVRDEAHRFAITYHRQRRSRSMTRSALDGVAGLGETRRQVLLKHFGSVRRLRAATIEEIAEIPGFGVRSAAAIVAALRSAQPAAPAINVTTGEILEDDSNESSNVQLDDPDERGR